MVFTFKVKNFRRQSCTITRVSFAFIPFPIYTVRILLILKKKKKQRSTDELTAIICDQFRCYLPVQFSILI